MTTRSKIFAAALSLVMVSGAVGGAFAKPILHTNKSVAITAPAKTVKVQKTVVASHHRLHVTHRVMKHKFVAHRVWARGKFAHKIGRTHLVRSHVVATKIAKRPVLVKSHLVKSAVVKKHFANKTLLRTHVVKAHVAKARFGGLQKHAMLRTTKTSIVR